MVVLNSHKRALVVVALLLLASGSACRAKFHRVPTDHWLGPYRVSVRPSCDDSVSRSLAEHEQDGTSRIILHEFTCGDTHVTIRGNMLSVNGKSYGPLAQGDWVAIDYGKVRVNSEVRAEVP